MKKFFGCIVALAMGLVCAAQTTSADFKANYERQVRSVGAAGLGVEGIINRWEAAFPDDPEVQIARFSCNYAKSQKVQMVPKPTPRFLGAKPSLVLKDKDGADVYYFEEIFYDEGFFTAAMTAIDKAIDMSPDELSFRFAKISALIAFEKESPDMAYDLINKLIAYNTQSRPAWLLNGEPAAPEVFEQAMGEYCYSFYSIGSEQSYEYFKELSEQLTKVFPKNAVFYSNIGSYWQAVKKNNKQALKFYNKALKIDPDNYAAKRNIQIIQSSQSKKGQPSK